MLPDSPVLLVAGRELKLLWKRRTIRLAAALLAALAWLPPLLLPLRSGRFGLASFDETVMLSITLSGVLLPLLALLAGTDLLAGEVEDGTLVPIVTLPISRTECFVGKCVGRGGLLAAAYLFAFGGAGLAIALTHPANGWEDYFVVVVAGLLLSVACGSLGVALGASGQGRVRCFGSALICWVTLVFLLDAALLSAVIVLAPPAPEEVGVHGHSEFAHETMSMVESGGGQPVAEPAGKRALSAWLMTLNPVDLLRLTVLAAGPESRLRLTLVLPGNGAASLCFPLAVGWSLWMVLPLLVGLWRFRRVPLV